jgi:hypothetical protein
LNNATLTDFCTTFFGYGQWHAPVWFIGIEEAGGLTKSAATNHLDTWLERGRKNLENAPSFYPASSNHCWHGSKASPQLTWTQLIRMLLIAQGKSDTHDSIMDYQRNCLGTSNGQTCLLELLPLPSPTTKTWRYGDWSNLEWLETREKYQQHMTLLRACFLARQIERHCPATVIFYGSTWHRVWAAIAGGHWHQAINQKLMGFERDNTAFFVTKHPADPKLGPRRDGYFREIGCFFRDNHGTRFSPRK